METKKISISANNMKPGETGRSTRGVNLAVEASLEFLLSLYKDREDSFKEQLVVNRKNIMFWNDLYYKETDPEKRKAILGHIQYLEHEDSELKKNHDNNNAQTMQTFIKCVAAVFCVFAFIGFFKAE